MAAKGKGKKPSAAISLNRLDRVPAYTTIVLQGIGLSWDPVRQEAIFNLQSLPTKDSEEAPEDFIRVTQQEKDRRSPRQKRDSAEALLAKDKHLVVEKDRPRRSLDRHRSRTGSVVIPPEQKAKMLDTGPAPSIEHARLDKNIQEALDQLAEVVKTSQEALDKLQTVAKTSQEELQRTLERLSELSLEKMDSATDQHAAYEPDMKAVSTEILELSQITQALRETSMESEGSLLLEKTKSKDSFTKKSWMDRFLGRSSSSKHKEGVETPITKGKAGLQTLAVRATDDEMVISSMDVTRRMVESTARSSESLQKLVALTGKSLDTLEQMMATTGKSLSSLENMLLSQTPGSQQASLMSKSIQDLSEKTGLSPESILRLSAKTGRSPQSMEKALQLSKDKISPEELERQLLSSEKDKKEEGEVAMTDSQLEAMLEKEVEEKLGEERRPSMHKHARAAVSGPSWETAAEHQARHLKEEHSEVKWVVVHRSGDLHSPGLRVPIAKQEPRNFSQLLDLLTTRLGPMASPPVQHLYTTEGIEVESLAELVPRETYVASGGEGFKVVPGGYKAIDEEAQKKVKAIQPSKRSQPALEGVRSVYMEKVEELQPQPIYLYRNGDRFQPAVRCTIPLRDFHDLEKVLQEVNIKLYSTREGFCDKLFNIDGSLVRSAKDLRAGGFYVAATIYQREFEQVPYGEGPPAATSRKPSLGKKSSGRGLTKLGLRKLDRCCRCGKVRKEQKEREEREKKQQQQQQQQQYKE